jgi:hypothetical protein
MTLKFATSNMPLHFLEYHPEIPVIQNYEKISIAMQKERQLMVAKYYSILFLFAVSSVSDHNSVDNMSVFYLGFILSYRSISLPELAPVAKGYVRTVFKGV